MEKIDEASLPHRPFYSTLVLHPLLLVWTFKLITTRRTNAFRSGLMMSLLEFPLEWTNEKVGPLWSINSEDTNRKLREGFPSEAPLGFYFGATVLCLLTEERSSSLTRRWIPALLSGLGGVIGESILNRLEKLEWRPSWGSTGVFGLYSTGVFAILSFRDQPRSRQRKILMVLLIAAALTFPYRSLSVEP